MASSPIRFTGLASGLDTESIVNAMIAPQQAKVDYAVQDKKLLELKKDAWKEMNTKIYSFYTGKLSTLKFNNSFGKVTNTVSNPNVIKVDDNASIPQGTHEITIESTAKAATLATESIKKDSQGTNITVSKDTNLEQLGYAEGDKIFLNVNGKEVSIEVGKDMKIADLQNSMNAKLEEEGIKNVNFKFESQVSAFIIGTTETGSNQSISMKVEDSTGADSSQKLKNLGILESSKTGGNAKFKYNGSATFESQTNKVEVNGVKFTITGTSAEPITISAVKDTSSQMEFIKEFVNEYNTLLEEMNKLVDAPSASDYRPLTDEQKADMTESDIKLWEEKIKTSILRKDSTLTAIAGSMRSITGNSELYKLGISTSSNYKEKGKLHIDEDRLKEALDNDPQKVNDILKEVGTQLYDNIKERLKGNKDKSSNYLFMDKILEKNISDADDKIARLEERLVNLENSYYAKYAAMEKMMSQLNSQSSIFG